MIFWVNDFDIANIQSGKALVNNTLVVFIYCKSVMFLLVFGNVFFE
jgi:hypothetical protein